MKSKIPLRRGDDLDDSFLRRTLQTGVFLLKLGDKAPTASQLKAAWRRLSPELLADCPPGCRPWAFYAYDPQSPCRFPLSVQRGIATRARQPRGCGTPLEQLELLDTHGLLRPGEKKEAERFHRKRHEALPCIKALRARRAAEQAAEVDE